MVGRVLGIGCGNKIAPILVSSGFFLLEGSTNFISILGDGRSSFSISFSSASLLEFMGEFSPKPSTIPREI